MDAFYASVEQRDEPQLRGKPVIVGGLPGGRGVVAAASYEAREFGVRSAMPTSEAYRLCPKGVFVKPRFPAYRETSFKIMQLFHEVTPLVEPLSLDEAYLDVTSETSSYEDARNLAVTIKDEIKRRTKLTGSAGVAPNKFLAKVASAMRKPDGLTTIFPELVYDILTPLPIRKVPGVGRVTEEKLHRFGVKTVGDLRRYELEELEASFGKLGAHLFRIAAGEDNREVQPERERKSISVEDTFSHDLSGILELELELAKLAERLTERVKKRGLMGYCLTLKVKFSDFTQMTRSRTFDESFVEEETILERAKELLTESYNLDQSIRLLGIGISSFSDEAKEQLPEQLGLFDVAVNR